MEIRTASPEQAAGRWPEARAGLSIERKLPLFIGALLLLTIVALAAAAYVESRNAAVQGATVRLRNVATQFSDLFRQSSAQLRARLAPVGADPAIAAFLVRDTPASRARALTALRKGVAQSEQVVATEIRSASGSVLLSTAPGSAVRGLPVNDVLPASGPADSGLVGAFRVLDDTLIYAVSAPVPRATNATVVRWRRLGQSQRSREQINALIGTGSSLFLGNADGSRWSNLERPVEPLSLDRTLGDRVQRYQREGTTYFATVALVPGTPWMVALDVPEHRVLEPVNAFMRRLALIALAALALGLLAAWLLSRRITGPLRQLTQAAQAMSAGDYEQHVRLNMTDEFGILGDAFSTMAAEVQHSRDNLEHQVEERTRDLNDALRQLNDAQGALVRRERLAMLGQLSSGVGHELRNPLGVMTNAVYYLKTVLAQSPPNVHEYLDIVQQQITLSEKIVGDLLDFARAKPPERSPTSLRDVTMVQAERLAPPPGIQVRLRFPDDLPPALVDPVQCGQIVLNLLTNAVQAMGGEGQITVRARRAGPDVEYEISDTGPGVPAAEREKIFEPLYTTKARGIGLGLAVSRTLARANGGELDVRDTEGQGASFVLRLPVAEGAATRPAAPPRSLGVTT